MQKLIYLLLLFLFFETAIAQDYSFKRRHMPGEKAVALMPGINPDGGSMELSFTRFRQKDFMYSFLFTPSFGKVKETSYSHFQVGYRPQLFLWNYRMNGFLSAFGSAYTGLEFLNNDLIEKNEHRPFFTVGAGLEFEYYISNTLTTLMQFEQDYNLSSKMGDYAYSFRIGLRYSL